MNLRPDIESWPPTEACPTEAFTLRKLRLKSLQPTSTEHAEIAVEIQVNHN
jgi:hypothetical protein